MFKRKAKEVDVNRPEAVLANEMFDLAAKGDRDGVRKLIDPPRFTDATWNDVLATYMMIIAEEPAALMSLRDIVGSSGELARSALQPVQSAIEHRDWHYVKPMTPGAMLVVMFTLANCIAENPHAILRLSLWSVTNSVETPT